MPETQPADASNVAARLQYLEHMACNSDDVALRSLDLDLRLCVVENALKTIGLHESAPSVIALPDTDQ